MTETITRAGPVDQAPLPKLWPDTAFYWTSGSDGHLRILQCARCGRYVHPPTPTCRHCGSPDVAPAVVSGDATVWSFGVVYQPFIPWLEVPYVVAIVGIDEDPTLHLTTNIVGCPPEDVSIGMAVKVRFEQHGEIFLPLFVPRDGK